MTSPTLPLPAPQPSIDLVDADVDPLIAAAAQQIANRGLAAVSSRSVAQEAGVAASAIAYRFGGIEQLFGLAFARGAALSEGWWRRWLAEAALLPGGGVGAALLLEHVIAAWTGEARCLALLYQEALAASAGEGAAAGWTRGWRDFWREAAAVLDLGEVDAGILHIFFESEALYHLSAWAPALERAALREMCEHVVEVYLGGPPTRLTGALEAAVDAAGVVREGSLPASAAKIVEAAAAVVAEKGLPGLTHRAVAQRAGVTTGAVTHHFRTMESLVAGTIRGQVMGLRPPPTAEGRPTVTAQEIATADQLFDAMEAHIIVGRPTSAVSLRRHLFLACLRRPDMAASAAVIRFAHGGTLWVAFDRVFAPRREERTPYAGVLARLAGGSCFAASADDAPRARQTVLLREVKARLLRQLGRA